MSNEELRKLSVDLKNDIKKVRNALSQLETDVAILQTGDANGAYWSGPGAYTFVKSCLAQIDHDNTLLANLEKCSAYIDSLIK